MEYRTNEPDGDGPFAEDRTAPVAPTPATLATQTGYPGQTERPASELLERAASLFESGSGWHYRPATTCDSLFFVHHRVRDLCYLVFVATEQYEAACTCPDFAQAKTCVHLLAICNELAFLAWVEEQERFQDDAEHPVYGTDPGMHYDRAGDAAY